MAQDRMNGLISASLSRQICEVGNKCHKTLIIMTHILEGFHVFRDNKPLSDQWPGKA
jgi:hypothetical protein